MTQIHYSIQPQIQGRPAKDKPDPNPPRLYKDGFQSRFTTVQEFAKAVSDDGYLWSGSVFKHGSRTGGNFSMADTFSLDIDNADETVEPTTVDDVLEGHPLSDGICLIYHSGSSTPERPRFRVVFRLDKPIRDRREYRLFAHRMAAVSVNRFSGLDNTNDEARVWYGNNQGAAFINPDAAVNLDKLAVLFAELDESIQKDAENAAIRRVASRSELVKLGLMEEKAQFAGDPETDQQIFKLCLRHIPRWEAEGWYQDGSWILGAAVESFGVDVAAEVLEEAWGAWPRDHKRPLFSELQQWERGHGNPAGFGSVVNAAQAASTWTDEDQEKLDELQKTGPQKAEFFDQHQDVLDLDSVREIFGCSKVETASELDDHLKNLTTDQQLHAVDAAVGEMISSNAKRAHRVAKARAINSFFGSPYESREMHSVVKRIQSEEEVKHLKGAQPLHGLASIFQAVEEDDTLGGYIIDKLIPAGAFTIVGGAPKVGKTSLITAACTRALLGAEGAEGLETKPVSHLTIFSDDQKTTVTGTFIMAAITGLGLTFEQAMAKAGEKFNVYPSLTLDEDGIERLSTLAAAQPGGIFIIDSLASTAGRLGIDENSSEIGGVVATLRNAIQMVDPTATVLLIHHLAKGGSNNRSATDAFRGSSAITGACDNQLLIERPTEKRNGNSVDQDLTPDRMIHIRGRSIGETKVVIRGHFDYPQGKLTSCRLEFIGSSDEYNLQQAKEKEAEASRPQPKTRLESLSDAAFTVFSSFQREPLNQATLQDKTGFSQSKVAKALQELISEPPLVSVEVGLKNAKTYRRHPQASQNGSTVYHLQD